MKRDPTVGDKVSWSRSGGEARSPTKIKSYKAAASKENPEFIVQTDDG